MLGYGADVSQLLAKKPPRCVFPLPNGQRGQ
jgi:hypothetical protein